MTDAQKKRLGVIVNPVAGMGGRVGLKGTDGIEVLNKARELGARPESPHRTVEALKILSALKETIQVITFPAEMGEDECREAGFDPTVIGTIKSGATTALDTKTAAIEMVEKGVSLILFAGGDGTARNIHSAIGAKAPVLGIPAGVKIHSGVFAVTPRSAGTVAMMFLEGKMSGTREAEVMDIDETAFRQDIVAAELHGYLLVPEGRRLVQNVKTRNPQVEKKALLEIAADVIRDMRDDDTYYIIGPGTTPAAIMQQLGRMNTLLGVDVICNRKIVANDVGEHELIKIITGKKAQIVVTPIGGQGHIFGRGNQQLSPRVIREVGTDNIIVIATLEKLISLSDRPLLVDTGDEHLDEELSGYRRVTIGFNEYAVYKVEC
jgi:predicted polyphosphate/ATP-dependent NAD kinase